MKRALSLLAITAAFPAFAEDTRQLDAHEHGVGTLNIAIEKTIVSMAFKAPGADIVGFEYAAKSDADIAAIDAAIAKLGAPLDLFVMPSAAACSVVEAAAELETEDGHEEHGDDHHDEHAHDDHGDEHHDEHAHDEHGDEHDHDEHENHAEEGHGEEKHDDHGHDDRGHEDHAEDAGHAEFHAEYTLNCSSPDALGEITFAYFETFPNAKEVEVQLINEAGATAYEVERDQPVLALGR
ncbi:zinc uptake protein ZrgA [Phaeobacter sp. C3_T13_0]|uniref:zinc uptake protein ZrgA n=1 Tax=Phaeobacter cretensis TaxID=3342641 RepID=UPI0039BD4EAF